MKKCGNTFFQCLRHTQQEKHGIRSHNSKLLSENSAMQTEKQKVSPGNPEHQKGVPEHITDVDLLQMVQAVSNGIDTRSSDTCTVLVLWLQQLNVWSQCVSVAPYCHSANAEWHSHPPVWFWSPLCSISLDEISLTDSAFNPTWVHTQVPQHTEVIFLGELHGFVLAGKPVKLFIPAGYSQFIVLSNLSSV